MCHMPWLLTSSTKWYYTPDVLRLIEAERTTDDIAHELGITQNTVNTV